jgi:hypothetical protein
MKRVLALSLILGISTFGLAGCGEKTETTTTETNKGPGGTTQTEVSKSVKSTGENPPPNSAGETGGTANPTPK